MNRKLFIIFFPSLFRTLPSRILTLPHSHKSAKLHYAVHVDNLMQLKDDIPESSWRTAEFTRIAKAFSSNTTLYFDVEYTSCEPPFSCLFKLGI
jgi:hypothetical protein